MSIEFLAFFVGVEYELQSYCMQLLITLFPHVITRETCENTATYDHSLCSLANLTDLIANTSK
jgi:hypothetical protein